MVFIASKGLPRIERITIELDATIEPRPALVPARPTNGVEERARRRADGTGLPRDQTIRPPLLVAEPARHHGDGRNRFERKECEQGLHQVALPEPEQIRAARASVSRSRALAR